MADKRLAGTRILMVIAPLQFRDEELLEPRAIFIDEGAAVQVACRQLGQASGMLGATHKPDLQIKDAKTADYQALVVVGGMGSPDYLWDDLELHRLVKEMNAEHKVVAAICLSGAVLAKAGVLDGKQATVWPTPESLSCLERGRARYSKQHLVQDGRVITADGPQAAKDFAKAIVNELCRLTTRV